MEVYGTYPKHFMEQFMTGDRINRLFVAMPFHSSFDSRFSIIRQAAIDAGFEDAYRSKEILNSNAIVTKILDGIANSRMVLCDLSNDEKGHVNGNVLYETGIATTIREPHSVVLIRDQGPSEVGFDVQGLTIKTPPKGKLTVPWLVERLREALEEIDWSQSKRIEAIARRLDEFCLYLINKFGRNPDGYNNFSVIGQPIEIRLAAQRLVDLGIVWFNTAREIRPLESSYWWTTLAKDLMKYLKLPQLTFEEFKNDKERWERRQEAENLYRQSIDK